MSVSRGQSTVFNNSLLNHFHSFWSWQWCNIECCLSPLIAHHATHMGTPICFSLKYIMYVWSPQNHRSANELHDTGSIYMMGSISVIKEDQYLNNLTSKFCIIITSLIIIIAINLSVFLSILARAIMFSHATYSDVCIEINNAWWFHE
jgi:hypothetical protein